jgi:riboflavin kinase/FMN adenylyltransferase
MQLVREIGDGASVAGGFVSIGNFDGLHVGHARIVQRLVESAAGEGVGAVVLTFDPHPIQLLRPESAPPLLSTIEDRALWLGELGVDVLLALPTTRELLSLEAEEFFGQVVVEGLDARGLVEGPNFCFGRDRRGDTDVLRVLCQAAGIGLELVDPASCDGEVVSSSRVRAALAAGDVESAGELLGRAYSVRGTVVAGEGRGRELGVPTANLSRIPTLVPGDGVYAGAVEIAGSRHPAAVHVGGNPTFGEPDRKVEVHLLAFEGDLYGQELTVEFLVRVRGTEEFESVDRLREQLAQDIEAVWRYVEACAGENGGESAGESAGKSGGHGAGDGLGTGEVGGLEVS